MKRELWPVLYRAVCDVAARFQQKYVHIPASALVLTMFWAAIHEMPVSWACVLKNWTTSMRPPRVPSQPTMSRRIDSVAVGFFYAAVDRRLREKSADTPGLLTFLDGKPLCIGGASKDPDAGYGRAVGGKAKGYKLHTLWSNRATPEAFEVVPMNQSEKTVAHRLLSQIHEGGGYLLADGNYDSNRLFDDAWRHGYQMVLPVPRGSPGHIRHSPQRLRSIAMGKTVFGEKLYQQRIGIEQRFANATSFGGGLNPLPAWVRGLDRVRTWVWSKLLINAARILTLQDLRRD